VRLLAVLGTRHTRAHEVLGILDFHRSRGRFWTPQAIHEGRIQAGDPVVAKVAGVSELWMTGTLRSGEISDDPHPGQPERWRYSYAVTWDAPAPAGIPAVEVLGNKGRFAQTLVSLTSEEFSRARRALYGES
jgi:hypothetical protein